MKPSLRQARAFCHDIIHHLAWLELVNHEGYDKFNQGFERKLACLKAVSVIGEASKRLVKSGLPEVLNANIPWRLLVDKRNDFVHEYFSVDMELLWAYLEKDLLPLKGEFLSLLTKLSQSDALI